MEKVILDTNFLLLPYTEKIDIFTELDRLLGGGYALLIPHEVKSELARIRDNPENKGKDKTAARIALELIEKKGIEEFTGKGSVDDQIVEYAKKEGKDAIACTSDRELKRRLKEYNIRLIGIRSKRYLDYV